MKKLLIVMMVLCWGLVPLASGKSGELLYEYWSGIGGGAMGDLTGNPNYPDNPTGSFTLTSFDAPVNRDDNFGGQITGYLIGPPGGGLYTFWEASDDDGEFWISPDTDPAKAVLVSWTSGWAPHNGWDNGNVTSGTFTLSGGKKHYVMARYKEGGGGDNCGVAWQGPAIGTRELISGAWIATDPYGIARVTAPSPADGTVEVDPDADLTVTWGAPSPDPNGTVARYDVYLMGDPNEIGGMLMGSVAGDVMEFTIDAANLRASRTYNWRVDTIVDVTKPNTGANNAPGNLWAFTTVWLSPIIDKQPADAGGYPGDDVSFSVEAHAALPITGYQWYGPAGAIAGATSDELVLSGLDDDDTGDYYVVITNADGSTTSASAGLVIVRMIGHWTFDEGAGSVAHDTSPYGVNMDAEMYLNQSVHPDPNAHWEPNGMVGGCYDGFGGSWFDSFLKAADIGLEGNNAKSCSAWVYTRGFNNGGIFDLGRRSGGQNWCLRTLGGDHRWRIQYWGGDWSFQTTNWTRDNDMNARPGDEFEFSSKDAWVHFVLTHGPEGTKCYANGHLIVDWAGKTVNTGDQFTFRIGQYGPNNQKFNGLIDDMRLYDKALGANQVRDLYFEATGDPICVDDAYPLADLNRDCRVNITDLGMFVLEYLLSNTVPERQTKPY